MTLSVSLVLHPAGITVSASPGTPLRELLFAQGVEFPCGGHGYCRACRVRVVQGQLPETDLDRHRFSALELEQGWRLACGHRILSPLVLELAQWDTPVLTGHKAFSFSPRVGLGIAIDLGTTTLAAQLLCLQSGETLAVETALNPQGTWGADVMSRIHAALYQGRAEALRHSIRVILDRMIRSLSASAGVAGKKESCIQILLVGNTVMHHLFAGHDLKSLAAYPFESPCLGPVHWYAEELDWTGIPPQTPVCFLPCLGGFVGSDILAGIMATEMHQSPELRVLVDLGTNGEMVVGNRDGILCASTAAGPAFEGGRISCGMRAAMGAVDEIRLQGGKIYYHVIGGGAPRGLCGSGLVDAVALGLDTQRILPSGRLADGSRDFLLEPPVSLTQKDIRELQLAKAATAAGLQVLLKRVGRCVDAVPTVHLAGAFGNYINRRSAQRIGLLPFAEDQIEPAGNTALLGAKRFLFSDNPENEWQKITRITEHVPLAADPAFQEIFTDQIPFPEGTSPALLHSLSPNRSE